MRRSLITSDVLFRNVDPVIIFGIFFGLLGGLGLAIGGNLLILHIMGSYQSFLQKSLIGLRGSLTVEFATPELMQRFEVLWEKKKSKVANSKAWYSKGATPVLLRQGKKKWNRQVKIILLEQQYLEEKMSSQKECERVNASAQLYGNSLLFLTLVEFDPFQPVVFQANVFGKQEETLNVFPCALETGMMTDFPILFLSWEGLKKNTIHMARHIEFSTHTLASNRFWVKKINTIMQSVPRKAEEWFVLNNLFESKKMKLASSLSNQAEFFTWTIGAITLVMSLIILYFGFALLLEFKRRVLNIIRVLGISRGEVALGFMIRGLQIGLFSTLVGCLIAIVGRWLIESAKWIPFDGFFTDWKWELFLAPLFSITVFVGIYSAIITYLILYHTENFDKDIG